MPARHTPRSPTGRPPIGRTGLALVVALVVASCGGDDEPASTTTSTVTTSPPTASSTVPLDTSGIPPTDYEGFRAQPTACDAEPPAPAEPLTFDAPADLDLDPAATITATIVTSCGDIVIDLDPVAAPETVNSFVFLAEQDYFDGTASHRILPGFVIQAGDPTATGRGGPGYVVPDELPPQGFAYDRGIVAMANAGPNTTGSQFFIMLGSAPLPPSFSAFGQVVEGDQVLDSLASVPLGPNRAGEPSVPLATVYIEDVVIERP